MCEVWDVISKLVIAAWFRLSGGSDATGIRRIGQNRGGLPGCWRSQTTKDVVGQRL